MHIPPLRYRLLLLILSPVLSLLVLWQAWKCGSKRFALQRLGFGYGKLLNAPLWIHCASVGEVQAALPLIQHLRSDAQFAPLIVSTATPTGADTVAQQKWSDVQHVYLAVDLPGAVERAFRAIQPHALLIMETEIWPNLINRANRASVPVVIVNARLSARTSGAPRWLLPVYRQALSKVDAVLAKSDDDAKRFVQLGAPHTAVQTLGNLKFSAVAAQPQTQNKPFSRRYWLAASTHDDEEAQLCKAWQDIAAKKKPLLVIAPRHPKRREKILEQLRALNVNLAVRSLEQMPETDTEVYLADTLGEMPLWLQHAELVFMGGTLVPVGGHNLLEPAAAAKAIVSGPHLHNFAEEASLLAEVGALQAVETAVQAITAIDELLSEPERCARLGQAGHRAVQANNDMLERYTKRYGPW